MELAVVLGGHRSFSEPVSPVSSSNVSPDARVHLISTIVCPTRVSVANESMVDAGLE